MVEGSADKSYELCLINIHESVSTCLWKITLVCLGLSYGGVVLYIIRHKPCTCKPIFALDRCTTQNVYTKTLTACSQKGLSCVPNNVTSPYCSIKGGDIIKMLLKTCSILVFATPPNFQRGGFGKIHNRPQQGGKWSLGHHFFHNRGSQISEITKLATL